MNFHSTQRAYTPAAITARESNDTKLRCGGELKASRRSSPSCHFELVLFGRQQQQYDEYFIRSREKHKILSLSLSISAQNLWAMKISSMLIRLMSNSLSMTTKKQSTESRALKWMISRRESFIFNLLDFTMLRTEKDTANTAEQKSVLPTKLKKQNRAKEFAELLVSSQSSSRETYLWVIKRHKVNELSRSYFTLVAFAVCFEQLMMRQRGAGGRGRNIKIIFHHVRAPLSSLMLLPSRSLRYSIQVMLRRLLMHSKG